MEKSLATAQATALAEDTRPVRPEVIYADCLGALEEAWRAGLSREVPVRTLAPAILADATIAAEAADERLSPGSIAALGEAHLAAITEVWSRLKDTAAWDDAEQIALTAAIAVASEFQGEILCAALLREEDFRRPSAVVTVRHDGSALARRYFYFRAASA